MFLVEVGDGVTGGYQLQLDSAPKVNAVLQGLVKDWGEVRIRDIDEPGTMLVITATGRKEIKLPEPKRFVCVGSEFQRKCQLWAQKIMKERGF